MHRDVKGLLVLVLAAVAFAGRAEGLRARPERVLSATEGVTCAEGALCPDDGKTCTFAWTPGAAQPVAAYDFGPATAGGYAVFTVSAFAPAADGTLPVLRLAYATHPDGLSETGDFTRETCIRYLNMDNPVLPANVNRHELYTIPRTGRFVAPLIQGQERYVRVQLDTPGTSVTLDSLEIVNAGVHSVVEPVGSFAASDPRFGAAWALSQRTCQIASFPNHDAWKVVDGVLLPRRLMKGAAEGWCRYVPDRKGMLEVTYEFRRNPHFPKGRFTVFTGWLNTEPDVEKVVEQEGSDGEIRTVSVPVLPGRFGFRLEREQWPMIHRVVVKDAQGRELWHDDFSDGNALGKAVNWAYSETGPYVADGGKRDRLVWSGDLWWAVRSVAYGFGPSDVYYPGAIRLLAFNQTPEGFCQAAPFAENAVKPRTGEYGHFASDEFSAWVVPAAWEWFLYSGDRAFAEDVWPALDRELGYIAGRLGSDGLFAQRYETSKHAANMKCGDTERRLYMDLVCWMGWRDGARFARALGRTTRADELERLATAHAAAIRRAYLQADGTWRTFADDKKTWINHAAYAMLLASQFLTAGEAKALVPRIARPGAGKMQALLARGLLNYGFTAQGLRQVANSTWYTLCDPQWAGAHTTSECMFLVTTGFWDESHPDTAIADVYSAYVLGVTPTTPGFATFRIAPQLTRELTFAEGRVPTPHGFIEARWDRRDGVATLVFTVPEGMRAEVAVGGRTATFGAGRHTFAAPVSDADLADPFAALQEEDASSGIRRFAHVMSQPYPTPDYVYEPFFDLEKVRGLEQIVLTAGADVRYADRIEVEVATVAGQYEKVAARVGLSVTDGKTSVAFDVRTAGGPQPARYVRFKMTGLPQGSPNRHVVRLEEIKFVCAE